MSKIKKYIALVFLQIFWNQSKLSIVDMHPMGLGRPEDVAHACVFLLSDAARWITGTGLVVDGGYSMA